MISLDTVRRMIQDAEMVLAGIGEEFEGGKRFRGSQEYQDKRSLLEESGKAWAIPALNRIYLRQEAVAGLPDGQEAVAGLPDGREAVAGTAGTLPGGRKAPGNGENRAIRVNKTLASFRKLETLIRGKNYFVVTVSTDDYIWESGIRRDRIAAPCGGSRMKQCGNHLNCQKSGKDCGAGEVPDAPSFLTDAENSSLEEGILTGNFAGIDLGNCPRCQSPMVLNNVYTEQYDERGYLDQWKIYTKWLQGTVNRRLLILELGVGLQCPGVIRFPFEKIGYYNKKSSFVRVNENLYQLPEGLEGRGVSVRQSALEWLLNL